MGSELRNALTNEVPSVHLMLQRRRIRTCHDDGADASDRPIYQTLEKLNSLFGI